jgi:hypothetical protein
MLLKLLIISSILIIISFSLLGISILIKKHGKFPNTHISQNKEMQKRGISCAQHNDVGCNPTDGLNGCSTCGVKNL